MLPAGGRSPDPKRRQGYIRDLIRRVNSLLEVRPSRLPEQSRYL